MTEPKDPIRPCSGTCGRMTRPPRISLKDAPGTVVRKMADLCATCFNSTPEEMAKRDAQHEERVEAAHRANAAFLAARQARMGKRTPLQRRMELVSQQRKLTRA